MENDKKKALVNGNDAHSKENEALISGNDPIFESIPESEARFNGNQKESQNTSPTSDVVIVESPISDTYC